MPTFEKVTPLVGLVQSIFYSTGVLGITVYSPLIFLKI